MRSRNTGHPLSHDVQIQNPEHCVSDGVCRSQPVSSFVLETYANRWIRHAKVLCPNGQLRHIRTEYNAANVTYGVRCYTENKQNLSCSRSTMHNVEYWIVNYACVPVLDWEPSVCVRCCALISFITSHCKLLISDFEGVLTNRPPAITRQFGWVCAVS